MSPRRHNADRPSLWLIRQLHGLVPAFAFDADLLERYRIGAKLIVTIEQPKDDAKVRRYRAIVGKVAKGIGMDPDSLHWRLRLLAGFFKEARDYDGSISMIPMSTTDMEGDQFDTFYAAALELIVTKYCPGADIEDILDGVYEYAGLGGTV